jgi:hypothetical protein
MRRSRWSVFVLSVILVACSGCGGSVNLRPPVVRGSSAPVRPSPTATPTMAGAGSTAPAALAAITPEPGLPPVAPLKLTLVEATPYPETSHVTTTATLPTALPYADVSASSPPADVVNALLAVAPTPVPGTATLVLGTIAAFSSNTVTLQTAPFIAADPSNRGGSGVPLPIATPPAMTVLTLSGATVDAVPGGFASMRVGDRVIAAAVLGGAAPVAQYLSDLTVLGANVTYQSRARSAAPQAAALLAPAFAARSAPGASHTHIAAARRRPEAATPVQFILGGTSAADEAIELEGPAFPNPLVLPFATIDVDCHVIGVLGGYANYPLTLEDESDQLPWIVGQTDPLPISVINGSSANVTYSVVGTSGAYYQVTLRYPGAQSNGTPATLTAQFETNLDLAIVGENYSGPLLNSRASPAPLPTTSPMTYVADIGAEASALVAQLGSAAAAGGSLPLTLNLSLWGELAGGPIESNITVSNASPSSLGLVDFEVDSFPISMAGQNGFMLTPTGTQNTVVFQPPPSPTPEYQGLLFLASTVQVSSVASDVSEEFPFNPFAEQPDDPDGPAAPFAAFEAVAGGASTAPSITLTAVTKTSCVGVKNLSSNFNDGGGISSCSNSTTPVIADDAAIDELPGSPATGTVQVSDTFVTPGQNPSPNSNATITIDLNDLPPASLLGSVPPTSCSSANVTVTPLSLSGATATFTVTLPGTGINGCQFAVHDQNGAKVYYFVFG